VLGASLFYFLNMEKLIKRLELCEERLQQADNNLRYIRALQSYQYWLLKLYDIDEIRNESNKYHWAYKRYLFNGNGLSLFSRVNNSIVDYTNGNKPF